MKAVLLVIMLAAVATAAEPIVAKRVPGVIAVYAGGARHVYNRVEFFCDGTFSKLEVIDAASRERSGTYDCDGQSVFLRYGAREPSEELVSVAVDGAFYLLTPGMWKIFEDSQRKGRASMLPFSWSMRLQMPNKAPEPTTMTVTPRAPSSTSRASHGRGSS